MHDFLKNEDLDVRFSEKVDHDLKNVVLYAGFSEKSGPLP